ncbi:MAG TPA: hypothetical protein VGU01_10840 [Sphingomicrobium sp.]|nr:hypothetical protein [Sphingomicrobium sp.]
MIGSAHSIFAQGATRIVMEVKMRGISVVLAGATLASCTAVPPAPTRTPESQRDYVLALQGKVPLPPVSCLPNYQAGDMKTIDDNTILFRQGSSRVWVAHMEGPCTGLGSGHYALVTHQYGGQGLCRGDIAQVVDTLIRMPVGSCVFGDFTPFVRPRS